ncbi:hypothetical protein FRB91_003735 [Serendipita sp. 411]|nr:hypothetical protein FRB91_003735 [Serendipita sp. 411]
MSSSIGEPLSPSPSHSHSIGIPKSSYRPCILVSCTQSLSGGTICQIALLATFGDTPLDELSSPLLQHFSIPLDQLGPRYGLGTKDVNKTVNNGSTAVRSNSRSVSTSGHSTTTTNRCLPGQSSANGSSNTSSPTTTTTHEYVVACIGSVRSEELSSWIDPQRRCSMSFSETAMRRLDVFVSERRETWTQLQPLSSSFSHGYPRLLPIATPPAAAASASASAARHIYDQQPIIPHVWQTQSSNSSEKEKHRSSGYSPNL